MFAVSMLAKAGAKMKQDFVLAVWDLIIKRWDLFSDPDCIFPVGDIEVNKNVNEDFDDLRKKTVEYFTKKSNRPHYFGLCSNKYSIKDNEKIIDLNLEIRFNGYFYVGIYGTGIDKAISTKLVKKFYSSYQALDGWENGNYSKDSDIERIYIKSKLRFDSDNKDVFEIIHSDKSYFVESIFSCAQDLVSKLNKRGLQLR